MVIPHSEQAVISFRLPLIWLQALSVLLIVFFILLLVFGKYYSDMLGSMDELKELRIVTCQQRQQINDLAAEARVMQDSMERLRELDQQLREMMRMGSAAPTGAGSATIASWQPAQTSTAVADIRPLGRGGGGELSAIGVDKIEQVRQILAELESVKDEMVVREESLENLRKKLVEHQAAQAHTPSVWPVQGQVSSYYGYRRSPFGSGQEFHPGVDIAAPYGTPVVATADGKVSFVGWRGAYGRAVIIDHGYGYRTMYGHNSKTVVNVGQTVKKGQIIAYVGSSGRSTGPHVHYEVHVNGTTTNPWRYMSR